MRLNVPTFAARFHLLYRKPVGLLNVQGYYDTMLQLLEHMVRFGFLKQQNRGLCIDAASVPELLDKMAEYEYQAANKWL